ncbi:MAG: hypothetical protein LBR07_09495 [Puniceicoccales bacterium]|jgi:uncharacterized membrane protein YgcG|nr:hypothetical protein [Puniceicoccales bacterium]
MRHFTKTTSLLKGAFAVGATLLAGGGFARAQETLPPEPPPVSELAATGATTGTTGNSTATAAVARTETLRASVADTTMTLPPAYEGGAPTIEPIPGTVLAFVTNSTSPVIVTNTNFWFTCENGIWFTARAPTGPWRVATSLHADIARIPAGHPVHFLASVKLRGTDGANVWFDIEPGYYAASHANAAAAALPDEPPPVAEVASAASTTGTVSAAVATEVADAEAAQSAPAAGNYNISLTVTDTYPTYYGPGFWLGPAWTFNYAWWGWPVGYYAGIGWWGYYSPWWFGWNVGWNWGWGWRGRPSHPYVRFHAPLLHHRHPAPRPHFAGRPAFGRPPYLAARAPNRATPAVARLATARSVTAARPAVTRPVYGQAAASLVRQPARSAVVSPRTGVVHVRTSTPARVVSPRYQVTQPVRASALPATGAVRSQPSWATRTTPSWSRAGTTRQPVAGGSRAAALPAQRGAAPQPVRRYPSQTSPAVPAQRYAPAQRQPAAPAARPAAPAPSRTYSPPPAPPSYSPSRSGGGGHEREGGFGGGGSGGGRSGGGGGGGHRR